MKRQPIAGDIVVMKVARHYHVSRVQADGEPFAALAVKNRLVDALDLACRSATGGERVFLYDQAGSPDGAEFDCTEPH
jgi:hypothetical protein